jgi:hypothetical protein
MGAFAFNYYMDAVADPWVLLADEYKNDPRNPHAKQSESNAK